MKIFKIILSGILLMQLENCLDFKLKPVPEIDKLPSITESGKNTFGCLINGKAFLPFRTEATYDTGELRIIAYIIQPWLRSDRIWEQEIKIILNDNGNELKESQYSLTNDPHYYAYVYLEETNCEYTGDNIQQGYINISKFDKLNHIIAGTFELTAGKSGCDSLKITDGRFDLKYLWW